MKNQNIILFIGLFIGAFFGVNVEYSYAGELEGGWVARIRQDYIQMMLVRFEDDESKGQWNSTVKFKKDEFTGLKMNQEHDFKLIREAGTLSFHGKLSPERGFGDFVFEQAVPDILAFLNVAAVLCKSYLSTDHWAAANSNFDISLVRVYNGHTLDIHR